MQNKNKKPFAGIDYHEWYTFAIQMGATPAFVKGVLFSFLRYEDAVIFESAEDAFAFAQLTAEAYDLKDCHVLFKIEMVSSASGYGPKWIKLSKKFTPGSEFGYYSIVKSHHGHYDLRVFRCP